jgi:DNA-binding response OmpR family regulator
MTDTPSSASTCPMCSHVQEMPSDSPIWTRCSSCQAMIFRPVEGPRVVVGHESVDISQQTGEVLLEAGFHPLRAKDGSEVLKILESHKPPAAVLDVALGKILAFQVIHYLRARPDLKETKVVLIASVYSKTAYKRKPQSLYGADDYVEQHHIPDKLTVKLKSLMQLGEEEAVRNAVVLERADRIREAEPRIDLEGLRRVRTVAHNIVADIALYNQSDIEKVVKTGDLDVMASVLQEGRRLLAEMVDIRYVRDADPIMDAFQALIDGMRREK